MCASNFVATVWQFSCFKLNCPLAQSEVQFDWLAQRNNLNPIQQLELQLQAKHVTDFGINHSTITKTCPNVRVFTYLICTNFGPCTAVVSHSGPRPVPLHKL